MNESSVRTQIAAEASVISAALRDRSILADLAQLTPVHFQRPGTGKAWHALISDPSLRDVSAMSIIVPGVDAEVISAAAQYNHGRETVARARDYLIEAHARRELSSICRHSLAELDSEKGRVTDIILKLRAQLADVNIAGASSMSATDVARALSRETPYNVIPTGIAALDYVLYGGLHIGQMTGLLARYKVGKSVLMATVARNLEKQGVPTVMFSLERQRNDIERFIIARSLGIDARDLDVANDPQQQAAYDQYLEDPRTLRYVHRPGITIDELRATLIGEVQRHGIKVALIDYWQLITAPSIKGSREERQAEAGQMIANIAAELDIAALVTGQLSADGNPRGSEGLLASAGIVVKLNRPDNADEGFLQTMVSNKGKPLDKGSPVQPSIELALPGPHFRDIAG